MKTLPVAVGFFGSVFLAALTLQTMLTTKRSSTQMDRTSDVPVAEVGSSHASSMPLPQTNVDAASYLSTAKRLLVFARILPRRERIVVFYSGSGDETAVVHAREAAKRLGVGLIERPVRSAGELAAALSRLRSERIDGIFHVSDPLIGAHVDLLFEEAAKSKIPTMTCSADYVAKGALMAYGIGPQNRLRQEQTKGEGRSNTTKETTLSKRAPRYELVLNLDTADRIDFTFPQIALNRADHVIGQEVD